MIDTTAIRDRLSSVVRDGNGNAKIFNGRLVDDAAELLDENARLRAELEAAKRDLHTLSDTYKFCDMCKYHMEDGVDTCTHPERFSCDSQNFYEWRGPCAEDGGANGRVD